MHEDDQANESTTDLMLNDKTLYLKVQACLFQYHLLRVIICDRILENQPSGRI